MSKSDDNSPWVPKMFPKQYKVFNCKKRCTLVSGPRLSGKTISVCHKALRHLWETPGARIALVSRTKRLAKDGGVWKDLVSGENAAIKEWIGSGIGMQYTTKNGEGNPGPKQDSETRTTFLGVTNYWGGTSELYLLSIDNDDDIEEKLKSSRWSMIWFSELSMFNTRDIIKISLLQLRMPHLRFDQHQFIADTNPSDDGEDFWGYKLWYEERAMENHPKPNFQKNLDLIELFIEDNPFLDQQQIEELEGAYSDDPSGMERMRYGKWIKGGGKAEKHFADVFNPHMHIIGSREECGNYDMAAIKIPDQVDELIGGWDLGMTNNAACGMARVIFNNVSYWMILFEVCYIGVEKSTDEFTKEMMEQMWKLEKHYKKKFHWRHWSDDTAINVYRPTADTYDYLQVRNSSSDWLKTHKESKLPIIELMPVNKPSQSVRTRVQMVRSLIRSQRMFVGYNCPHMIEMFKGLTKGSKAKEFVDPRSRLKHAFDCMSYVVFSESAGELEDQFYGKPEAAGKKSDPIISVRI